MRALCALTIRLSINGALVEAHDILSESSCLVAEDVFNLNMQKNLEPVNIKKNKRDKVRRPEKAHLAQLLIQSGCPGLSCCVTLGAEHVLVPVNEVTVTQPDHLHTDAPTCKRGHTKTLI